MQLHKLILMEMLLATTAKSLAETKASQSVGVCGTGLFNYTKQSKDASFDPYLASTRNSAAHVLSRLPRSQKVTKRYFASGSASLLTSSFGFKESSKA